MARDGSIRRTEIQTAEPFVPEPSIFEFEDAIGKLKIYKSSGADQIPAELIKVGGGGGGEEHCILICTKFLSSYGTKKNFLTGGRNHLSYLFTKMVTELTAVIIWGISLLPTSYKIFFSLG
jgi:hypothetical protein